MLFPTVHGENLEGRPFTFPEDLTKEKTALIIAFQREQHHDVATWASPFRRLTQEHSDLDYYELPTIAPLNSLARRWINRGMRAGVPDQHARATTITLYLDKEQFRQALQLPDEERIYLLLVARTGEVLWRTEGRWTEEKEHELAKFLFSRVS